ncbi:MAG: hypothetical protein ACRD1K_16280 [Acidimicrobiales bacterium]
MARRRPGLVAGGALALVVVLLAGVALVARLSGDDGDNGARLATDPGPVPPRVPATVPAGLELAAALDLPLGPGPHMSTSLLLYGDAGAAHPLLSDDLAVYTSPVEGGSAGRGGDDGAVALTVRGHDATFTASFAGPALGLQALRWSERENLAVQVVSRSFIRGELVAAAESFDFPTAGDPVPNGPLPRGVTLVARQADASVPSVSVPVPMSTAGHVVSYTSPDGPDVQRSLVVGTYAGGAEALHVLAWFYGPAARPVTLAGHPGLLASVGSGESERCRATSAGSAPACERVVSSSGGLVAAWTTTGRVVVISSTGVTEDDLLAAAASVEVVDDREWQRLRAAAGT